MSNDQQGAVPMTRASALAAQTKILAWDFGDYCISFTKVENEENNELVRESWRRLVAAINELAAMTESNPSNLSGDQIRESGEKAALDRQRGYTVGEDEPNRYSVLVDLAIFDAMAGRSERWQS